MTLEELLRRFEVYPATVFSYDNGKEDIVKVYDGYNLSVDFLSWFDENRERVVSWWMLRKAHKGEFLEIEF